MFREELAEYQALCESLRELHRRYGEQKAKVLLLIGEMEDARRHLFKKLRKTYRLGQRLTNLQKKQLGFLSASDSGENGFILLGGKHGIAIHPEEPQKLVLINSLVNELPEACNTLRELNEAVVKVLSMVDIVKKELLRMELLEMRLRELLVSIKKAMEAHDHVWRQVHRLIYPFGIFSLFFKYLRELRGAPHFTEQDLNELSILGRMAGNIVKIADTPVLQGV